MDIVQKIKKFFIEAFQHNSKLAKNEPSWGNVDKTKLPRAAFAEHGEGDKKSSWGYPHHWVTGGKDSNDDGVFDSGTMYLHKGGLRAAWAAANGARSGQQASSGVKAHLRRHMSAIGMTKADLAKEAEVSEDTITAWDNELILAGLLTLEDLKPNATDVLSEHIEVDE